MQRASQVYIQTKVTTTSQGDIVLMLYDAALKFITQAKERIDANDMAGKGNFISRTLDIINELDSTLNVEKGGDLAKNLHNLYHFCTSHLLKANIHKDKAMLDEVATLLTSLRSAFAAIAETEEGKAGAAEAAAIQQQAQAGATPRQATGLQLGLSAKSIMEAAPQKQHKPMPGANVRARTLYAQTAAQLKAPEEAIPESEPIAKTQSASSIDNKAADILPSTVTTPDTAEVQLIDNNSTTDKILEPDEAPLQPQPTTLGFNAGRMAAYKRFAS